MGLGSSNRIPVPYTPAFSLINIQTNVSLVSPRGICDTNQRLSPARSLVDSPHQCLGLAFCVCTARNTHIDTFSLTSPFVSLRGPPIQTNDLSTPPFVSLCGLFKTNLRSHKHLHCSEILLSSATFAVAFAVGPLLLWYRAPCLDLGCYVIVMLGPRPTRRTRMASTSNVGAL